MESLKAFLSNTKGFIRAILGSDDWSATPPIDLATVSRQIQAITGESDNATPPDIDLATLDTQVKAMLGYRDHETPPDISLKLTARHVGKDIATEPAHGVKGWASAVYALAPTSEGIVGDSERVARSDHRHPMPSPSDVGAQPQDPVLDDLSTLTLGAGFEKRVFTTGGGGFSNLSYGWSDWVGESPNSTFVVRTSAGNIRGATFVATTVTNAPLLQTDGNGAITSKSLGTTAGLPVKTTSAGGIVEGSWETPVALGATAAEGDKTTFARSNHVHPYPTAANVGALPIGGGTLTGSIGVGTHGVYSLGTNTYRFGSLYGVDVYCGASNAFVIATGGAGKLQAGEITGFGASAAALGTSSAGAATTVSRSDHVHPMPSAADVGAAAAGHTHSTYDNSTALTGSTVYSTISVTDGIVTGLTTRALAAADVGAQASSANLTSLAGLATNGVYSRVDGTIQIMDFDVGTGASTLARRSATGEVRVETDVAQGKSAINITTGDSRYAASSHTHSTYAATSHDHGNITSAGKIAGITAITPIATTVNGTITAGTWGTTAGTFCQGDDTRLSDARTPTSHAHGNLTNDGKVGTTANLPIKTGTGGAVAAGAWGTPVALGATASEGSGSDFARSNHVHPYPTAANVGAQAASSNLTKLADSGWTDSAGGGKFVVTLSTGAIKCADPGGNEQAVNKGWANAAYAPLSDTRLKTAIEPLPVGTGLPALMTCAETGLITFAFQRQPDQRRLGLSAQVLETVAPLAIRRMARATDDPIENALDSDILTVDPLAMLALTIDAIATLHARIETLESSQ